MKIGDVVLIGPGHPHRGEHGVINRIEEMYGDTVICVELPHCNHGVGNCYVWPGDWKVTQHA